MLLMLQPTTMMQAEVLVGLEEVEVALEEVEAMEVGEAEQEAEVQAEAAEPTPAMQLELS